MFEQDDTTLERTIYFYWVNAGVDKDTGAFRDFDPKPYLETIQSLVPGEDSLYMPIKGTKDHLLAAVDSLTPYPMARWVRVRRADFPEVELEGHFDPLEIADRAGLADRCHIVYFGNNIVGADFNSRAPRLPAFARYLTKKANAPIHTIEYLIARDMLRRLDAMEQISMLDIRVTDPNIGSLDDTVFFEAFRRIMKSTGAFDVEIVLRKKRNAGEDLGGLKAQLKRLARSATRRADAERDDVSAPAKLKVKGVRAGDEGSDEIDLLHSRLGTVQNISRIRMRSRALAPDDAYRAIVEAYEDIREEIDSAASYRIAQNAK